MRPRKRIQHVDRPAFVGHLGAGRQRRLLKPRGLGGVAGRCDVAVVLKAAHEMEHQVPVAFALERLYESEVELSPATRSSSVVTLIARWHGFRGYIWRRPSSQ